MRSRHFSSLRRETDSSLLIHSILELGVSAASLERASCGILKTGLLVIDIPVTDEIRRVIDGFNDHIRDIEHHLIHWHVTQLHRGTLQRSKLALFAVGMERNTELNYPTASTLTCAGVDNERQVNEVFP